MLHTPDLSPDAPEIHPVILYGDLYAEDPRAPQTQFVLDRQIAFLEALATTGSVRAAARRARVSHQTCYRARRNSAAFGRAWDAALVVARATAEEQLADAAINGLREEVWYHGELVGYRTRQSDRLMLAHLARLDRLRADERVEALAEDFDAMLRRMRAGEPIEVERVPAFRPCSGQATAGTSGGRAQPAEAPACAGDHGGSAQDHGEPDFSTPGPCNRRSMSQADAPEALAPCPLCGGACEGPEEALTEADCQWFGNRMARMDAARPRGALKPHRFPCGDPDGALEYAQLLAFEAGEDAWWLLGLEDGEG